MEKIYTSLGLMSGTSMDGVDASIIRSNGEDKYEVVFDQYFKYDKENIITLFIYSFIWYSSTAN